VAHPVNPPYLIPAVEISPAPFTRPEFVSSTVALLSSVGQSPIVLRKEIPGFVMNRLQSLIACEAVRLVEDGCVDVEDLDRAVKDGLGLRWSFMGPLETLDLNADGGFAKFAEVFAPIMHSIDASPAAAPRAWSPEGIAQIDRARREQVPLSRQHERIAWRDRQLMALIAHKRAMSKNNT
jgi:3-hydroxyacyl-CoA dehydrogenase